MGKFFAHAVYMLGPSCHSRYVVIPAKAGIYISTIKTCDFSAITTCITLPSAAAKRVCPCFGPNPERVKCISPGSARRAPPRVQDIHNSMP